MSIKSKLNKSIQILIAVSFVFVVVAISCLISYKIIAEAAFNVDSANLIDFQNNDCATVYDINEDGTLTKLNSESDGSTDHMFFNALAADTSHIQALYNNALADGNNFVVALDPGHGGDDPGACSGGLRESDLNWNVANACAAKLQEYRGVSVIITRSYNENPSLKERCQRAKNAGAQLLVSLHMNAASATATGSEVWIPYDCGWFPYARDVAWSIGSKILNKLNSVFGLANRGLKSSLRSDCYPNGDTGDYLGMIFYARQISLASFLVEHAFIDGNNALLQDPNNVYTMGVLDAEAIAEHFGFTKTPRGENIVGTYMIEMAASENAVFDVEDSSTENQAKIKVNTKNSSLDSQKWRIVTDSEGYATLINVNSDKCFDTKDGLVASKTPIQQYTFDGTNAQKWAFVRNNDGTYTMYSKLGQNMVVDVDDAKTSPGTTIKIFPANGNIAQKIKLKKVEQPEKVTDIINGTFYIEPYIEQSYCLDVYGASKDDGANVQLYQKNNTLAQQFMISTSEDGYSIIYNKGSYKVLDVYSGWTYPFTNIQQYGANFTDAQKWKLIKKDDAYFIMPKCNENLAIDIAGGEIASGTNIRTYYYNKTNAQLFKLEAVYSDIEPSSVNIEPDTYRISLNKSSNNSVEVKDSSTLNGSKVQNGKWNKFLANKVFKIKKIGNYYYFINENSGKAIDAGGAKIKNGEFEIRQWDFISGNEAQMWAAYSNDGGVTVQFKNRLTNAYLTLKNGKDLDGQDVYVSTSKVSTDTQNWCISKIKFEGEDFGGDTFYIDTSLASNKTLDVASGSLDNAANVQIYSRNGTPAQLWKICTDASTHLSTIMNVKSGKYIDVSNGQYKAGQNIWQYEKNNTDAQKWKIVKDGSGYRILSSHNNYLALDLYSANPCDGGNINLFTSNATPAQKFNIISIHKQNGEDINGDYYINFTNATTKVIDVSGGSVNDCANVQVYDGNASGAQQWRILTDSTNHISTIQNIKSGKYLDASGGSSTFGTNVWQYSKNASDAQKWKFIKCGSGYEIVSALNDFVCLDSYAGSFANYNNIQLWERNGSAAQNFSLVNINVTVAPSTATITESTYRINCCCASNKVLDITGAGTANGTNVQTWDWNGSNAQVFTIKPVGNYYRIINYGSNKSLDVSAGNPFPGTNVQIWDSVENEKNQLWAAYKVDNSGTVEFVNVRTGLSLDILGGSKQAGANVQVYTGNGSTAQHFTLSHAEPQPMGTLIMYGARTNIDQMVRYYNSKGKVYPSDVYSVNGRGAANIKEFCTHCYNAAISEGVDPAVLFCQAMLETGWLQFGGDVKNYQCNFGGLGATGGGKGGATFSTVYEGLLAQTQHLKCYASTLALNNKCVDPRWDNVISAYGRGCAPCVENLNGKWAVPGDGYGQKIVSLMNELCNS